jgi:hypothetical protein
MVASVIIVSTVILSFKTRGSDTKREVNNFFINLSFVLAKIKKDDLKKQMNRIKYSTFISLFL